MSGRVGEAPSPMRAPATIMSTNPELTYVEGGVYRRLDAITGSLRLLVRCVRTAVAHPRAWWPEFVVQTRQTLERIAIPLAVSISLFAFGVGVIFTLLLLQQLGGEDRLGYGVLAAGLREFCSWTTGMCVAGIAGTAITADLGARKVREELDATEVLGVDPYLVLVVPRFLALVVLTPMLYLWAVFWVLVTAGVAAPLIGDFSANTFVESFRNFVNLDLLAGLVKMTIVGVAVATISCYKGMSAAGGPSGVGRAVHQGVVASFGVVWLFNLLFNAVFLASFPRVGDLR